jgi:cyclic pyranopterin phosphate synthase
VSLDTLKPDKFEIITRSNRLSNVLEGIATARSAGLNPVKINMVVMSGINDDELLDFAAKTIDDEWHVRFIELMPLNGDGTVAPRFISAGEIRGRLKQLGKLEPCLPGAGNGPAKYFRFSGAKGTIGFITPISEHFCFNCNRLRLTSDGKLRSCLLADEEVDLKKPLRKGISPGGLKSLIEEAVAKKPLCHKLGEGQVPKSRPFFQVGG